MSIYVRAYDCEMWDVITDGSFIPMIKNSVNGKKTPKDRNKWMKAEMRRVQINSKAMHTLICGLDYREYDKVSMCKSAKEIWEKLEELYGETKMQKEEKPKKNRKSKKSMVATTWSDSDTSSSNVENTLLVF
ncbi:hypothetical protein QQP08_013174 [Theobroma cacao]|nr:hypothetical protein QQP08_013174 [Theobroma cacao]